MDSAYQDLLLKQAPVVVVLIFFCWILYQVILKLNAKVDSKDDELKKEREEVITLYAQAIAQNEKTNTLLTRGNELQNEMSKNLIRSNEMKVEIMSVLKSIQLK